MDREIILKELKFTFSRSAGSGGQHVNKVSTKVELSFEIQTSEGLNVAQKATLLNKLSNRINLNGLLKLNESTTRSQLKNRQLATKKFFELITEALIPEKRRKKLKPSKKLIENRLKQKKQHSEKKNQRKKVELPKQFDLFSFKCVSFVSNI